MPEAICLGEMLIDMLPDREGASWEKISHFTPVPGGAPANVCIGFAKLGVKAGFIGKVGKDPFGEILVRVLQENNVETSRVKFDPKARTTLAFVSIKEEENDFIFYRNPGADLMLRPEELDEKFIAESKIFHFGSISMTEDPCYSATLRGIEFACKHKVLISFDPNLRPRLWNNLKDAKEKIIEGMRSANIVKLNEAELEFITGMRDLAEGANHLLQTGPELVVVTRGSKGSFFCNRKGSGLVPGYQIKVVDTVGCGDAFTAALLHQLLPLKEHPQDIPSLSEQRIREILKFANAAGALTATKQGVIPSLPSREDVDSFLNRPGRSV